MDEKSIDLFSFGQISQMELIDIQSNPIVQGFAESLTEDGKRPKINESGDGSLTHLQGIVQISHFTWVRT